MLGIGEGWRRVFLEAWLAEALVTQVVASSLPPEIFKWEGGISSGRHWCYPKSARTFCLLSSMLPFRHSTWLPEHCRGPGCLGTEFPILCTLTPSTPLFFVLFFSQCVFINVAPSFYIHCLAFLCSSFQHFLASSSHPYPPTYFLLPQAFLLLCALPTIFILYHPFCYHPTFFILLSFFFSTKHFLNIF